MTGYEFNEKGMMMLIEKEFTVRGYECGYGGPLRPLTLADLLQEAASMHAERLGVGAEAMEKRGLTWMLSRLDLRVDREPREGERIVIRTWPAGFEKLFAVRDFEIIGEDGEEPIVRASYAYLVVDIAARKLLRAQDLMDKAMKNDRPRALPDARYSAEKPTAAWSESFTETARERHIDHNEHVNSAHLVAWLCDAPPAPARGSGRLKALRVEFAQEVLPGDQVQVFWAPLEAGDGKRHAAELRRGKDVCARAEIAWEENDPSRSKS